MTGTICKNSINLFLAKVLDPESPGDLVYLVQYSKLQSRNIKNVFFGQSFRTEGTQPREWSFIDGYM